MNLSSYLSETGISQQDFGILIGKSQPAVNRYVKGLRDPDHETIQRIHTATGGRVSWADWHPELVKAIRKSDRGTGAAA